MYPWAPEGVHQPDKTADDGSLVEMRCAVAVIRGDSVLLVQRPEFGDWVVPGGTPRLDESMGSCAESRFGTVDSVPGVEPWAAVERRAGAAFREFVTEYERGPLVLVSHEAFNRALLRVLDPELANIRQRTACWNQLNFIAGQRRVDAYDIKEH